MSKKSRLALFGLLFGGAILLVALLFINRNHIAVLNPQGQVATKEKHLMVVSTLLMLIVVIPVYVMTFVIAWKYRDDAKSKYSPDFDGHRGIETSWWVIPGVIILILAVLTWKSSHELDPFKPLSAQAKPITIEAVSLQWKWLFIYPQQNIATVNMLEFPANTPVNFAITSDAPMNSFWIPALSGQIYSMSGMTTHLHLMADRIGTYQGSSANISGEGFAGMHFEAKATSTNDFNDWVNLVRQTRQSLSFDEYDNLAKPSQNVTPRYYTSVEDGLFSRIIMKYMSPTQDMAGMHHGAEAAN